MKEKICKYWGGGFFVLARATGGGGGEYKHAFFILLHLLFSLGRIWFSLCRMLILRLTNADTDEVRGRSRGHRWNWSCRWSRSRLDEIEAADRKSDRNRPKLKALPGWSRRVDDMFETADEVEAVDEIECSEWSSRWKLKRRWSPRKQNPKPKITGWVIGRSSSCYPVLSLSSASQKVRSKHYFIKTSAK